MSNFYEAFSFKLFVNRVFFFIIFCKYPNNSPQETPFYTIWIIWTSSIHGTSCSVTKYSCRECCSRYSYFSCYSRCKYHSRHCCYRRIRFCLEKKNLLWLNSFPTRRIAIVRKILSGVPFGVLLLSAKEKNLITSSILSFVIRKIELSLTIRNQ